MSNLNRIEIKGGNLGDIMKQIGVTTEAEVLEATKTAGKIAAQKVVKILKNTSPKNRGKYARSWKVKQEGALNIVYNQYPGYTHLLENGHDVIRGGRKVGRAPAHPHIKPAEEEGKTLFVEEVIKEVERRLEK